MSAAYNLGSEHNFHNFVASCRSCALTPSCEARRFLPGRVVCPLAGLGARAANASNRLVVDEPATASVDGSTITLADDRDCAPKTVIADLVWLAEGVRGDGARVPFTIHLEVTKTGHAWAIDLHTHEPPDLPRAQVVFEPYEVVAVDRGVRTVLVDGKKLGRAAGHVPLKRRLSAALATSRDHLAGVAQDRGAAGYRVIDRSLGIGVLGRGLMLIRARLTALEAPPPPGPLPEMLRAGTWELSLEALTERWLPELVQRDLVLFGVADVPLLAPLAEGKLRAGQVLAFRFGPDGGEVRLDGATAPLPAAHDLAREYLEFHMLGGMIADAARRA